MKVKLKAIVVDDDPLQLAFIETYIGRTPDITLIGSFQNPIEALEKIINDRPDVIILDVEMPELSGFELIRSLDNIPEVILITGNEKYAMDAFGLNVTDFLLKPVNDFSRFMKAINKSRKNIINKQVTEEKVETFFIKDDSLFVNVKTKSILYVEAYGDYIKVCTPEKIYITHSTLSGAEKKLPLKDFCRVHRSFLVRLDQIENIGAQNLEIGGKIIPISSSNRAQLMSRIKVL